MNKNHLPTLSEVREQLQPIKNVNVEHREKLSTLDRIATWVTDRVGTMGFFFLIFIWTISWLLWNTMAPVSLRFDPYPAFVMWLFISNMIQIFLMPLLMIGQNLQDKHSETRAEVDFEVNLKAEKEIEAIFQYLEHQNQLLEKILKNTESKK